jgi:hypothetical protein
MSNAEMPKSINRTTIALAVLKLNINLSLQKPSELTSSSEPRPAHLTNPRRTGC